MNGNWQWTCSEKEFGKKLVKLQIEKQYYRCIFSSERDKMTDLAPFRLNWLFCVGDFPFKARQMTSVREDFILIFLHLNEFEFFKEKEEMKTFESDHLNKEKFNWFLNIFSFSNIFLLRMRTEDWFDCFNYKKGNQWKRNFFRVIRNKI